jgi:hypothetical protein
LQVHTGSPLTPVLGTSLLHDATGKNWFSVSGGELERAPAWSIDRVLGMAAEKSDALLREGHIRWAVGDAHGPRYAFFEAYGWPCEPSGESLFLERDDEGWRFIDEPPRHRSPPIALRNGDFAQGSVYVASVDSCGHAGPPFDYSLHTRGVPNSWPSPRRFSAAFMTGRQTFSEVAFSTYAVTPQGDVIVLGRRRRPDATDAFAWDGDALEIFRKGAKRTEIVPVETDDRGGPDVPMLVAASTREIVITEDVDSGGWLDTGTYKDGRWSWEHRELPPDPTWNDRVNEELRVDGVPFTSERTFRHAGVYWLVGKADSIDVTFVEGRVRWKSSGHDR